MHEPRGSRTDLSGRRFGRLTVIRSTDRRDGKGCVYWLCRCDCGNEVEVTGDKLLYGNYRSCGCLKEENMKNINRIQIRPEQKTRKRKIHKIEYMYTK